MGLGSKMIEESAAVTRKIAGEDVPYREVGDVAQDGVA